MPKLNDLPFALVLLIAVSAMAQETPSTDRVFVDSVQVDVVNAEVFVTDTLSSTASTLTWNLMVDGDGNVIVTDR